MAFYVLENLNSKSSVRYIARTPDSIQPTGATEELKNMKDSL